MIFNSVQRYFLFYVIPISLLIIGLFNYTLDSKSTSFEQNLFKAEQEKSDLLFAMTYWSALRTDPANIDHHFKLHKHAEKLNKEDRLVFEYQIETDVVNLDNWYEWLKTDPKHDSIRDIALLGHAFYKYTKREDYEQLLNQVVDTKTEYYYYIKGLQAIENGDQELALNHFNREWQMHPENTSNLNRLGKLLFLNDKNEKLNTLIEERNAYGGNPFSFESFYYLNTGQMIEYTKSLFFDYHNRTSFIGLIASIFIVLIWIGYLILINVTKNIQPKYLVLTFVLSLIFTFGVFPLSDLINMQLGFELNGNPLNDFLYCVIGIGLVEESVKLLPWLLVVYFFKQKDSIQMLQLACISALAFAFLENINYFTKSTSSIDTRALLSTVSHMFDASIIPFLIIYRRYKKKKSDFRHVLIGLAIAALAHGFYDYWLINEYAKSFWFFTIVFTLGCIHIWTLMINNALNFSNAVDENSEFNISNVTKFLLTGLTAVLIAEFVAFATMAGIDVANENLKYSMIDGFYLILFVSINLGKIEIKKGRWDELDFFGTRHIFNLSEIKGKKISIKMARPVLNLLVNEFSGELISKHSLGKNDNWFLIKLEFPINIELDVFKYVLVKHNHPGKSFLDYNSVGTARIIPEKISIEELSNHKLSDFPLVGSVLLNEVIDD